MTWQDQFDPIDIRHYEYISPFIDNETEYIFLSFILL